MTGDNYNLKNKSDTELHAWLMEQKPGTDEYMAGEEETMRRIAIIEEKIEKAEAPSRKRESIAIGMAIIALTAIIITIVLSQ